MSKPASRARTRELVGLVLLMVSGCEVGSVDVVRHGTATIPREVNPVQMMELDGLTLVLGELEDTQGIGPEDISDATLDRLTLEVLDPAQPDLAFVDRIEVFAEAPDLGPVRVAWLDDFPEGERVVELETDDVDLADYVAAPRVRLLAIVDGHMPPIDVHVRATAELDVGATLRGACDHAR